MKTRLFNQSSKRLSCYSAILFFITAAIPQVASADVNVLIIGSNFDSSDDSRITANSSAFSPTHIKTQLQSILAGANLGVVNVEVEERHTGYLSITRNILGVHEGIDVSCYNLASWYHYPYPANVETSTRWPNLRGELGKDWDYVILIEDPYTIEHTPGVFAHGVASIAEEVAKGGAETVLLMPWPAAGSSSTVDHYKEVLYRVGRTGGHKVAPAALAWVAAGSPSTANLHPNETGAFISAASIYSRIWNKSAKESTYVFDDALADTVYNTVTTNVAIQHQFSGDFQFQSPYQFFDLKGPKVSIRNPPGGLSTENYFRRSAESAVTRCGGIVASSSEKYHFGRDAPFYTNGMYTGINSGEKIFVYPYHSRVQDNDQHIATFFAEEMVSAHRLKSESNTYRILPRRLMWAQIHKEYPTLSPVPDNTHLNKLADEAVGAYTYTLFSGRCPVGSKPNPVTEEWYAHMIGYKSAWLLGRCQSRAPGFKVVPSSSKLIVVDNSQESIKVEFLLPPTHDVTVNVTVSGASATAIAAPSTLTFTPQNYNAPQTVVVSTGNVSSSTSFTIHFNTSSSDVVYDGLSDSWDYVLKPNTPPRGVYQLLWAQKNATTPMPITLSGADNEQTTLAYIITQQPANGTLGGTPPNVTYTPNAGFTGVDAFTFKVDDGSVNNNSSANVLMRIIVAPPITNGVIDFTNRPLLSYAGDSTGIFAVQEDGAALQLNYSRAKAIAYPYTITPNTILEFDFRSFGASSHHVIGFDADLLASPEYRFQVYGTGNRGEIQAFNNYTSSDGLKHYSIPVGQFFTGAFNNLTFETKSPGGSDITSIFSNIKIYEGSPNYVNWANGAFANPFNKMGATDNPDGDSLNNQQEYAFGTDPTSSLELEINYQTGGNVISGGSPKLADFANAGQPSDFRAVFIRRKDHATAGIIYQVEYSYDLIVWTTSAQAPTVLTSPTSASPLEAVCVPYPISVGIEGGGTAVPKFFRVRIILN